MTDYDRWFSHSNAIILVIILFLILPILSSSVAHDSRPTQIEPNTSFENTNKSVTFVSTQGRENSGGQSARIVAVDTDTKTVIWSHTKYKTYYDVDVIDNDTLLFAAIGTDGTYAVVYNWREDVREDRFHLPAGSHDVDYLDDGQYVAVDPRNHRTYIYNRTINKTTWEFSFVENYPNRYRSWKSGEFAGGFTHINDVDSVGNGSYFLASPRNFDRVVLVNRRTKSVEWTLGEENNYSILNEQHNPDLLSQSPPTVLVADSDNDRVVEYERESGTWELVWGYQEDLKWPRDADRLPNGNTLIVDSEGQRVIEVTPSSQVVWELSIQKAPYDVERLDVGERHGPPMRNFEDQYNQTRIRQNLQESSFSVQQSYEEMYRSAQWLLPWWVSSFDFATTLLAGLLSYLWVSKQLRESKRFRQLWSSVHHKRERIRSESVQVLLAVIVFIIGFLALYVSIRPSITGGFPPQVNWREWNQIYHGVGALLIVEAFAHRTISEWRVTVRNHNIDVLGVLSSLSYLTAIALGIGMTTQAFRDIPGEHEFTSMALVLFVLGTLRLKENLSVSLYHEFPTNQIVNYAIGVFIMIASIRIFLYGLGSVWLPGVYLAIGILLLFFANVFLRVEEDVGYVENVVVDGIRDLLLLIGGVLTVAIVLVLLGLGTTAGGVSRLGLDISYVGLGLLLVGELVIWSHE